MKSPERAARRGAPRRASGLFLGCFFLSRLFSRLFFGRVLCRARLGVDFGNFSFVLADALLKLRLHAREARERGETEDVATSPRRSHVYTGDVARSPAVTALLTAIVLGLLVLIVYAGLHWYRRTGDDVNANAPAANAPAGAPQQPAPQAPAPEPVDEQGDDADSTQGG